jgi:sRNA-binding carbon storage regulator CsrA
MGHQYKEVKMDKGKLNVTIKHDEEITLGDDIVIQVYRNARHEGVTTKVPINARLVITAPKDVKISRRKKYALRGSQNLQSDRRADQ